MTFPNRRKDTVAWTAWGAVTVAALLCFATAVEAQPTAEQVLTEMGFSAPENRLAAKP